MYLYIASNSALLTCLYGDLLKVSDIRQRWLHHNELEASKLILLTILPSDVRGKPHHTYINNLIVDTGLEYIQDLKAVMLDSEM